MNQRKFVSILFHEHPKLAFEQVQNILSYLPTAMIFCHWSASSEIDKDNFRNLLVKNKIEKQCIVNPESLVTNWGKILQGHISNAKCIALEIDDVEQDVILLSSNDWFMRHSNAPLPKGPRFQLRPINSYCHLNHERINEFMMTDLFFTKPVWSQIEGSVYPLKILLESELEFLYESLVEKYDEPLEEILLPSLALKAGLVPVGPPIVYSEVTISDVKILKYWNMMLKIRNVVVKDKINISSLRHLSSSISIYVNYLCKPWTVLTKKGRKNSRQLAISEILRIKFLKSNNRRKLVAREGEFNWVVYEFECLLAIKRIPRIESNRRKFIVYLSKLR